MTWEPSKLRDVVFYEDTIEFKIFDYTFEHNGANMLFDKETLDVSVTSDGTFVTTLENPAAVFGRDDWRTYVSPSAAGIKPADKDGHLMTKGVIRPEPGAKDMVIRPAHYSRYGIETIDALRGVMSPEEFNGFLKGNAFKYLTRAGAKDALEQDLHKVCWYAMFLYLQNGGSVESLGKTYEYMKGRFTK